AEEGDVIGASRDGGDHVLELAERRRIRRVAEDQPDLLAGIRLHEATDDRNGWIGRLSDAEQQLSRAPVLLLTEAAEILKGRLVDAFGGLDDRYTGLVSRPGITTSTASEVHPRTEVHHRGPQHVTHDQHEQRA